MEVLDNSFEVTSCEGLRFRVEPALFAEEVHPVVDHFPLGHQLSQQLLGGDLTGGLLLGEEGRLVGI